MINKYQVLKEFNENLVILQDIMGVDATSNHDIDKICSYIFGKMYIGTFSADKLPILHNGEMCILNTNSMNQNDIGHWVSFMKIKNKIYYYDSYNRSKDELSKYWTIKDMKRYNKTTPDQSINSNICGPMCIAMLITMNKYGLKGIDII